MVKKVIIAALLSVGLFCGCTRESENNLEKTQNHSQKDAETPNPSDSLPKSDINSYPTQSETNNNPNQEASAEGTPTPNANGKKIVTVNHYIKNYEDIFYYYGDELYDFPGSGEVGCRKVFKIYNIDSGT